MQLSSSGDSALGPKVLRTASTPMSMRDLKRPHHSFKSDDPNLMNELTTIASIAILSVEATATGVQRFELESTGAVSELLAASSISIILPWTERRPRSRT